MAVTIQTRRDDSTDWSTANPVLALGEIGIETDTDKAKYGDGFTAWNDLPYWIDEGAQIPDGTVQGQTLRYNLTDDGWEANSDLVVTDAGRVGIGTTSPDKIFHVAGTVATTAHISSTNAQASLAFSGSGSGATGSVRLGAEANDLFFNAGSAERMRISSTGNVGIGTDTPVDNATSYGSLTLGGNAGGILSMQVSDVLTGEFATFSDNVRIRTTVAGGFIAFRTGAGGSADEAMRLDASGNLLVGKTAITSAVPGFEARADGYTIITRDSALPLVVRRNGTDGQIQQWYNDGTAVAEVQSNGAYTGPISTAAVKHDISDSPLGLADVMQIPVRSFRYNSSPDEVIQAGFIAEELEQVVPQAVGANRGRADANLVPVLVKAIQEQQAQIDELRALING